MNRIDRIVLYECLLSREYKGTYTTGWKNPDVPVFLLEVRAGRHCGLDECMAVNLLYPPGKPGNTGYDEREALQELCSCLDFIRLRIALSMVCTIKCGLSNVRFGW